MRVLLDEQLPRQRADEFPGHDVRTVQQQAWSGLDNGELLQRAEDDGFEVFVTADRNLEFQQNLARSSLRVIVLVAPSNALEDLLPLVPRILEAIPERSAWSGSAGRRLSAGSGQVTARPTAATIFRSIPL